jgi:hypothetical protein
MARECGHPGGGTCAWGLDLGHAWALAPVVETSPGWGVRWRRDWQTSGGLELLLVVDKATGECREMVLAGEADLAVYDAPVVPA